MGLVASLLISAGTMILSTPVSAVAQQAPAAQGAVSLPYPDYHFQGTVGRTLADSAPAKFLAPIRPSAGAPNIVVILLDDVGFGQFSVTGGGVPAPRWRSWRARASCITSFTPPPFARRPGRRF